MYKASYFPRCPFLEADLGSNLSFVWRSLLAARDVIKAGSNGKLEMGAQLEYPHMYG